MTDLCSLSVPLETWSQTFRQTQKRVSRSLQSVVNDVEALAASGASAADAQALVRRLIEDIEEKKAAAERNNALEQDQFEKARARAEFAGKGKPSVSDWAWHQRLLDVAIAEFLLKGGDQDLALTFGVEARLENFLDAPVYATIEAVEVSLRSQDCSKALQWCSENASRLRRLNSPLVFQLTLQEFVELVRAGQHAEALVFAREKLGAFASEPEYSQEYQVAMATIALNEPEKSTIPEYAALFGSGRWDELARLFQREVRRAYGISAKGVLDVAVQAGLCALKTRACNNASLRAAGAKSSLALQCPVCSPAGRLLSETLPFPHRPQSVMLCPFTNEIVNEHNLPFMLADGRMISQKGLQLISAAEGRHSSLKELGPQDVRAPRQIYII